MTSSLLTPKQKQELNSAIREYLELSGYQKSAQSFSQEAELSATTETTTSSSNNPTPTPSNILERKWLSLIRLQLRVIELEEKLAELQQLPPNITPSLTPRPKSSTGNFIPRAPEKAILSGHRAPITCIQFHPSFGLLVSGSEDGSMRIWDCETNKCEETLRGHTNSVNSIDFKSGNGSLLASCSSDMSLKLWNFNTTQQSGNNLSQSQQQRMCIRTLIGHEHTVSDVKFIPPYGDSLLSCSRDSTIRQWDIETGFCTKTLNNSHDGWIRSLAVSQDGKLLASAGHDKTVRLWSTNTGEQIAVFSGHENVVECVCFAQKSGQNVLVSGSRDKTIRVWNLNTKTCESVLEGHGNWVRSLLTCPQCPHMILSTSDDKALLAWDLDELRCVRTIRDAHDHFVVSVAFCPVHDHYATAGVDALVKIWSTTI